MVSPLSYSSNPADGGILYLDGLTAEKDQRIQIVSFNDLLISPDDIEILEYNSFSSAEEKKENDKEARKIAYDIAAQFNTRAAMNGRCKNKFMGVVLSFPDSEREMLEKNPQMMEDIVLDWLKGMGFEDAQHFAVYHYDTAQPHIHVYVNMVGPDFKVYNSFQTKYRSQGVNRNIEKKYGLKPGIGVDKKYKVDREKTNPRNKTRLEIKDFLIEAMLHYVPSFEDLQIASIRYGITCEIKTMTNGKKGIVFHKDGDSFTGGEIGRQFTYGGLTKKMNYNRRVQSMLNGVFKEFGVKPLSIENGGPGKNGMYLTYFQMKDGRYSLLKIGKEYFISTIPADHKSVDDKIWKDVNGQVFSFKDLVEVAKALKTGQVSVSARAKDIKPESTSKTTTTSVGGTSPSFPVPAVPAAGHTVRDNKSAAHNGDGLDEYDEVVDENGNKVKVKKKKSLKL